MGRACRGKERSDWQRSLQDGGAGGKSTQQEARKICLGRILPRALLRLCDPHAGSPHAWRDASSAIERSICL